MRLFGNSASSNILVALYNRCHKERLALLRFSMVCRKTGQAQLGGGQEQLAAGALLEHAHAPRARRGRRRKKKQKKKKYEEEQ